MKRIILFFAVCLGLSVSQTTFAVDTETARVATKRINAATNPTNTNSKRTDTPQTKNTRTATKTTNRVQTNQNLKTRGNTSSTQPTKNVTQRTSSAVRTTTNRNVNTRKSGITNTETARSAASTQSRRTVALNESKMAEIKSADYSKCKTVYYECMDEFCANKDANLRRCACSARIHEFDNIKKQLDAAEDKMLDFNQRLLTVSLDKEDAAAINVATEGELAFNTKDKSKSEKTLQKISKDLNSSSDSRFTNELSSISLSLDLDTAWDDVNSLAGISTSSKSGTDLYNAARPICVEMAKEVCSESELKIAQDGYKVTIQQDCNTVAKSYSTLYNQAMEKIHESSALLDMSRLDVYQQKNSDDTLTCKKKIIDQLSDTSVCGENLYKCLDMTGEYINPSTGKAVLSENLYNLVNLLQEPANGETWSNIPKNEKFVSFLKSKKKFLEPAIKQCQDIADTIWREFLDDALAQIKLAQKAKLEEIKQGCTTLLTECKKSAHADLSEFDSRALSMFSVTADKTANEMCRDVENSCNALMDIDTSHDWSEGMANIATDITYDTIIDTCTQIGRDCIVQKCNGTSGNFALCTNIISDNRIAILKRKACWNEVLDCVHGADNLEKMNNLPIIKNRNGYYDALYTDFDLTNVPTFCVDENNEPLTDTDLIACLIAEQIWGNCETNNNNKAITTISDIEDSIEHNKILMPDTGSTLLSWFATNTGTTTSDASCSTYGCPINYKRDTDGNCQLLLAQDLTNDDEHPIFRRQVIHVTNNLTNFCESGIRDAFGNCCSEGYRSNGICVANAYHKALNLMTTTCDTNACDGLTNETTPTLTECQNDIAYYCPDNTSRQIYVYCITTEDYINYDSVNGYVCPNGFWIMIDQYGNYFDIAGATDAPQMSYKKDSSTTCTYNYNNGWSFGAACSQQNISDIPTDNEFMITY